MYGRISKQAQRMIYKASLQEQDKKRLLQLASELREVYDISKVTAIGKTYAVIPMETLAEYEHVTTVFSWLCEAWMQTINEQRETCRGVELFKACSDHLDHIEALNDIFAALRLYARND